LVGLFFFWTPQHAGECERVININKQTNKQTKRAHTMNSNGVFRTLAAWRQKYRTDKSFAWKFAAAVTFFIGLTATLVYYLVDGDTSALAYGLPLTALAVFIAMGTSYYQAGMREARVGAVGNDDTAKAVIASGTG
jgi:hypothetical protein